MNYMKCPNCGQNGIPAKGKAILPFGESDYCRNCSAWFEVPSYLVLVATMPFIVLTFATFNMIFFTLALLLILVISLIFYRFLPLKIVLKPRKKLHNWVVILPIFLGLFLINFDKEINQNQKLYIFISAIALTSIFDYIYVAYRSKTTGKKNYGKN